MSKYKILGIFFNTENKKDILNKIIQDIKKEKYKNHLTDTKILLDIIGNDRNEYTKMIIENSDNHKFMKEIRNYISNN